MNLTDEEIRIKVAESLGIEFSRWGKDWMLLTSPRTAEPVRMKLNGRTLEQGKLDYVSALPNYPEDLNACAEFEKTLVEDEQLPYWLHLVSLCVDAAREQKNFSLIHTFYQITAKPKQRCLAYLKTKGILP